MGESTKQNSFHIRLLTLPDHMHVINNMDVKMQIPLPSMQLWEVEDGPVVIEAPSADARIFMDGKWRGMDPWEDEALHIRFTPKSGHRDASVESTGTMLHSKHLLSSCLQLFGWFAVVDHADR